jgi:hypothetical protein
MDDRVLFFERFEYEGGEPLVARTRFRREYPVILVVQFVVPGSR